MRYTLPPSHPVPQPGVEVSPSHTTTLYAGTGLTLTCTVTLDSNVDSGESVDASWSGLQDIPEQRYSVTGASGSGGSYTGSLTISPLADQGDCFVPRPSRMKTIINNTHAVIYIYSNHQLQNARIHYII